MSGHVGQKHTPLVVDYERQQFPVTSRTASSPCSASLGPRRPLVGWTPEVLHPDTTPTVATARSPADGDDSGGTGPTPGPRAAATAARHLRQPERTGTGGAGGGPCPHPLPIR